MAVSVAFVAMWSDAPMLMMLPDSPRSRLLRSLLRHILQAWRAAAACYARLDTGVPAARACRSRPLRSSVAIPVAKKGAPLSCMRSYKYVPVVHLVTCVVAPTRISLRLPRCIHSKCDSQRYSMRLWLRNGANKVKRHRTRFSIDRFSTL